MKVESIRYQMFGSPGDVLELESRTLTALKAGEIRVRLTQAPINPSDLIPITGAYRHRISLPATPGYEGVGVVVEVGADVPSALLGQRVLPLRGAGTWQSFVTTTAAWAVPVPEAVDDDTACQMYINPVTAWLICTRALRLTGQDVLIVNAGGSAMGQLLAQMSHVLGFRLIAVCRGDRYTVALRSLGAWAVIEGMLGDLPMVVNDLTGGRGATTGVDCVGGDAGQTLIRCVRPGGSVLTIGLLSGVPLDWGAVRREHPDLTVKPYWLRHWQNTVPVSVWHTTFRALWALVQRGQLALPAPSGVFPLPHFREAIQKSQAPARIGKVFLAPSS